MRRLLPDAAETTVADAGRARSSSSRGAHDERPYLVTNFALTLDGHATIDGPLGADRLARPTPRCWSACAPGSTR